MNLVKSMLLDLTDASRAVRLAMGDYQNALDAARTAAARYSFGTGTKEDWFTALNEQALSRAGFCSALAEFTRQANSFNDLTGGWVSRSFGWMDDVFEPLFRSGLLPEEPAAGGTENP